jgi:hypothetical protein
LAISASRVESSFWMATLRHAVSVQHAQAKADGVAIMMVIETMSAPARDRKRADKMRRGGSSCITAQRSLNDLNRRKMPNAIRSGRTKQNATAAEHSDATLP